MHFSQCILSRKVWLEIFLHGSVVCLACIKHLKSHKKSYICQYDKVSSISFRSLSCREYDFQDESKGCKVILKLVYKYLLGFHLFKKVIFIFFLCAIWLPHAQLYVINRVRLTHPILITALFINFRP